MSNTTRGPVPQPWGDVYSADEVARAQTAALDLLRALQVIILTPSIAAYLQGSDPKALEQATAAVALAGGADDRTIRRRC